MKTYKRTRIIASLAILSSLTLSGVTYAATNTHPNRDTNSISRHAETIGREGSDPSKRRKQGNQNATNTPALIGVVASVNGSIFTVNRAPFKFHEHETAPSTESNATTTYTVTVTDGTTYMKNGKLDSLVDVIPGAFVAVTGILDKTTNSITALGVHIMDKPHKGMKHVFKNNPKPAQN